MKNEPEPKDQDQLLHAILDDESWAAASEQMRAAGLQEIRRGKWRRRSHLVLRCAAVLAVLAALITSIMISGNRPTDSHTVAEPTEMAKESKLEIIDDAQLLAMLPEGSAVVAEVNGEAVLVFLDPEGEALYAR